MDIDITQNLLSAFSCSKNWSGENVWKTLGEILELVPNCKIDWDEIAGENWGVVLDDRHSVSIVCAVFPIVIYREDIIGSLNSMFNYNIILVPVNCFDEKILVLQKGILAKIFGIDGLDIDMGSKPFSVNDLYYSTV